MTMTVMMARAHLSARATSTREPTELGPPPFVLKAQEDLHAPPHRLFEPHRDELAVAPDVAALALRSSSSGPAARARHGRRPHP